MAFTSGAIWVAVVCDEAAKLDASIAADDTKPGDTGEVGVGVGVGDGVGVGVGDGVGVGVGDGVGVGVGLVPGEPSSRQTR